jgi:hypothetical protein
LDLLPLRRLVVFAVGAPLTELADLLSRNRKTVHLDLRSAIRTLSERGAPMLNRPESMAGRGGRCAKHQAECPNRCRYLRRWLAAFDRVMPATQ